MLGASNKCWTSSELKSIMTDRYLKLTEENGLQNAGKVPEELLCASASGLDPHITEQSALFQLDRVCKYRNFNAAQQQKVLDAIKRLNEDRDLFFLGERRINVLMLNLEIDKIRLSTSKLNNN